MTMQPLLVYRLVSFLLLLTMMAACSDDERNTRIEFWITDSPGDYEEVNIDVEDVLVNVEGSDGWESLDFANQGVYNILELTNGLDTLLGTIELPAGKISQVRLLLGENNSVKMDGVIHNLKTPSAQQSGLKLQLNETFQGGITYKVLLDFDAARSIVHTGSDKYILKPVIRTITEVTSGAIKGIVYPALSTPAIYAISNTDTLATVYSNDAGQFLIRGLSPDVYTISLQPNEDYIPYSLENVNVSLGVVTDLDTIKIQQ